MESIKLNINYNSFFENSIAYILTILLGYSISVGIFIYLPKTAPSSNNIDKKILEYKRFNIKDSFTSRQIHKVVKKHKQIKREYQFLSNIILVAVYSLGAEDGYVIVKEKNKNDTNMLSRYDIFKGYKLSKIFPTYVIFTKNKKEYKLSINMSKQNIKYSVVEDEPQVKRVDDMVSIKRDTVNSYIKNFDKIWKDISINEIKTKNGIDGFKIKGIRKNSIFEKLGLKKNDIIKSVNNIKLKSYNDAFKIYKQIDKIKTLNIVILRNNNEKEITYEIR